MSDTMRKRLEQAVCAAATEGFRDDEPTCYAVGLGMPGRCGACLLMVDAILSVLSDPTDAMIDAGRAAIRGKSTLRESAIAGYRNMIAAIKAGA